jgi:hypothetical protein
MWMNLVSIMGAPQMLGEVGPVVKIEPGPGAISGATDVVDLCCHRSSSVVQKLSTPSDT